MFVTNWLSKVRLWEVAFAVLIGFVCYFVWTVNQESKQVSSKTVSVLDHVDETLSNVDSTVSETGTSATLAVNVLASDELKLGDALDKINALCVPIKGQILTITDSKNCGTLADISRTLQTLRGTIGTLETAGINFDQHQSALYNQETKLFTDTDTVINGFVPIQSKLDKAIFDADGLITSDDLTGSMHHFNTISGNFALASGDFQTKFHSFLFPLPCPKGFSKGFTCNAGKYINDVRIGSQFVEPAYWGWALFSGIRP